MSSAAAELSLTKIHFSLGPLTLLCTKVCLKTLINLSCASETSEAKVDELNDAAVQVGLQMLVAFTEGQRRR